MFIANKHIVCGAKLQLFSEYMYIERQFFIVHQTIDRTYHRIQVG